ncbi:MAG: hypothetical protein M0Q95_17895 [Porticoccaceae bacterium]|nr:hypothetical protein [Porticoccaceae bacterium]
MIVGNHIAIGGWYNPPPVVREVMRLVGENITRVVPPADRARTRIVRLKRRVTDTAGHTHKITAYIWMVDIEAPLPTATRRPTDSEVLESGEAQGEAQPN